MTQRLIRSLRPLSASLACTLAPTLLWAQVSLYQYSETVDTYTEVTVDQASYSLGVPTYWPPLYNQRAWVNNAFFEPNGQAGISYLNPAVGPGYPIGFDFAFNGQVFDVLSVSNSGFITFGKSSDGNQAVWTYSIDHPHGKPFVQYIGGPSVPYKRNRVVGWGDGSLQMQDQSSLDPPGPVSSIRLATLGTAPERTCVIQFKDFRSSYSSSTTLINFQIRLNEADNSVEVRFGQVVFGYDPGGGVQVGLGGSVPEDFNSRRTVYEDPAFLYDWNMTAAGELNTDECFAATEEFGHPNGSGVPPVLGRTFRWTPSVCPPPAWPLTINDISFDSGHAVWTANGAGEYEYFVSDTDDINGTEITSGTTIDPEVYFFGLEASTTYYVFIRGICDGEPGAWSLATPFATMGGGIVVCDGGALTENYCGTQNSTKEWRYSSADGSKLRIEFLAGAVSIGQNAYFKVWEGTDDSGTLRYTSTGQVAGQAVEAESGNLYIRLVSDMGACQAQPWFLPLEWRVGCKNCTDPLVNFQLGTVECDEQQFYVDVNVFSMGSATTLSLENNMGLPAMPITASGVYAVGPFPAGQSAAITAQNTDNVMCYSAGEPLINEPCALVDCGPTTYTYCYADNEERQWAYQGADGQHIGMRFLEGTMGLGDVGTMYDGLDIMGGAPPQTIPGGSLVNKLYTSTTDDHALVMELMADNAMSCQDADPLFGTSTPWKYVVACYDGCTQPQATFASTCLSQTQFQVEVTITNIGNTGNATITNNGGAANVAATAVGSYSVGPFTAGIPVTLNVEGASILCTWTSPAMDPDCSTVGIAEVAGDRMHLYPNPSNGTFQLELPKGVNGTTRVEVTDLTGRLVAQETVQGSSTGLHLEHLPNGLYTVTAKGANASFTSKISIQH